MRLDGVEEPEASAAAALPAAQAEDRARGAFLSREEWASAQGKKAPRAGLRLRCSRRSRPSARQPSPRPQAALTSRRTPPWRKRPVENGRRDRRIHIRASSLALPSCPGRSEIPQPRRFGAGRWNGVPYPTQIRNAVRQSRGAGRTARAASCHAVDQMTGAAPTARAHRAELPTDADAVQAASNATTAAGPAKARSTAPRASAVDIHGSATRASAVTASATPSPPGSACTTVPSATRTTQNAAIHAVRNTRRTRGGTAAATQGRRRGADLGRPGSRALFPDNRGHRPTSSDARSPAATALLLRHDAQLVSGENV